MVTTRQARAAHMALVRRGELDAARRIMVLLRNGAITLTCSAPSVVAEDALVAAGGTVAPSWDGWSATARLRR